MVVHKHQCVGWMNKEFVCAHRSLLLLIKPTTITECEADERILCIMRYTTQVTLSRCWCLLIHYGQSMLIVELSQSRRASEAKQRPFETFSTMALEHDNLWSRPYHLPLFIYVFSSRFCLLLLSMFNRFFFSFFSWSFM